MQLSDFNFELPEELIADKPLYPRDSSRLLAFDGTNITDRNFTDVVSYLNPGDILVFNDTKVIPARVKGKCKTSDVEVTLLKKLSEEGEVWQVLAKPGKKMIVDEKFFIDENFYAEILEKKIDGEITLRFNKTNSDFFSELHKYGKMPLPPYIEKKRKADKTDDSTYQTVYANKEGAVAAPTAGLHFTPELLDKIRHKGVEIVFVTLHVGAGTFMPVRTENILEHKMHSEWYEIDGTTAQKINEARDKGGKVVAVGTTALRVLESVSDEKGRLKEQSGETDIFIYPGYRFKIVDRLITNFHLPKSTLLMLVSAFAGSANIQAIYQHAISERYRFFSYGDASFLVKK